jgi:hypothetical protein
VKQTCAAVVAGLALGAADCAWGVAEMDAAQWFARHTDQVWQPLAAKWDASKASMTSPVENLTLPLDYYENGRMKAVLHAKRAQMLGEEYVFAEGVLVDLLTVDGKPDGKLVAEGCLFDRQAKRGFCRGAVHVVKGTDRIWGRGMYFSIDEQFIKILSECEIRTYRIPVKLGRLS